MMKFIAMLSMLLLFVMGIAAQATVGIGEEPGLVVDFATFTGIVSLVSLLVTQLGKIIPGINTTKWVKPLISVGVGILSCLLGWVLQLTPLLEGLTWYMVMLYGLFTGLSASGLYSILKPIIDLIFPPNPSPTK